MPSSRSRSCRASIRRSACSSTSRTRSSSTRCCAGATKTSSSAICRSSRPPTVGAYALSEAGSGSDAFALTTRAREDGRRLRDHRPQAVDHQRQRGRRVHRVRDRQSRGRLPRHHRVHRRARLPRVHRRQEGRQARHPRQQHLRADLRGLPGAEGERPRRGRQGLQDRRSKRSTKDASASARRCSAWPPARSSTRSTTRRSASSSARRSPSSRPCSTSWRARPWTSKPPGSPSTTRRACATPGRPFLTEAAICKIFSSEVAERVASLAVNLFGGNGFVKDYPGREALSRRQDRPDLRRHVEPAAADDRQADPRVIGKFGNVGIWESGCQPIFRFPTFPNFQISKSTRGCAPR